MQEYELVRFLGSGSYGQVELVRHNETQRLFVRKKLQNFSNNSSKKNSFYSEVESMSKLNHPNIINLVEAYLEESENEFHIIMEYADAGDLSQQISKRKSRGKNILSYNYMKEEEIMSIFVQIALGVNYLHNFHLLHRDLKTANILLTSNGLIKLCDFGFAKQLTSTMELTSTICGTPYYFSPEICQGLHYNYKSDIWSLGVILYEMINLRKPFYATSLLELRKKIVMENFESFSEQFYSKELLSLCSNLLIKSSTDRPSIKDIFSNPYVKKYLINFKSSVMHQINSCINNIESITQKYSPINNNNNNNNNNAEFKNSLKNISNISTVLPTKRNIFNPNIVSNIINGVKDNNNNYSNETLITKDKPNKFKNYNIKEYLFKRRLLSVGEMVNINCPILIIGKLALTYDSYNAYARIIIILDEIFDKFLNINDKQEKNEEKNTNNPVKSLENENIDEIQLRKELGDSFKYCMELAHQIFRNENNISILLNEIGNDKAHLIPIIQRIVVGYSL